jgi:hypothetical protein
MSKHPRDLHLHCRCGRVRGVANDAQHGFRFVCYCRDCQAFARFLSRSDVLDEAGGTEIVQLPVGLVKLTAGTDAVRCLQFSGRVFRWYADCCRTPIGNTAGPGFPVVGLIHSFMSDDTDGHSRDRVLGPPLCRIYARSAIGPLPSDAPAPLSLGMIVRRASSLLGWWLRGLNRPSPFFDDQTSDPLSAPRIFTASERAALNGPVHRDPVAKGDSR